MLLPLNPTRWMHYAFAIQVMFVVELGGNGLHRRPAFRKIGSMLLARYPSAVPLWGLQLPGVKNPKILKPQAVSKQIR